MPGILYVVATPIGNLEDVTFRAIRVLREVAVIAAEDTRRTARLLQHYSISTPTTSLHEHNERARTPSLISIWSSAPFLHNNMLGNFNGDPSVEGRLQAFNDAAEKLLWPEKRLGKASIWRTQNECYIHLRKEFVPKVLQKLADSDGYVKVGPVPKGTPVNLLANLEPSDVGELAALKLKLGEAVLAIHARNLSDADATAELAKAVPELLAANKCPDFIEDKGHYFGTDLADADKHALIEFLKTL
jgi:hypothetical protein